MEKKNIIWNFFSSVNLALFTLICLAVSSIIGTLIPQKDSLETYISLFGIKGTQFIRLFAFDEMYSSVWFIFLLFLLAVNLIVCSLDRIPRVIKFLNKDNLTLTPETLHRMPFQDHCIMEGTAGEYGQEIVSQLKDKGWSAKKRTSDEMTIFFAQRQPWSRLAVYLVHLSVLIIFAGAVYGKVAGFKASILLPEQQSSTVVYSRDTPDPIELGFSLRCDAFTIEFYDNGMPKSYRSTLTLEDKGQLLTQQDIEVNHPLKYKGITFFQSSFRPYHDFLFTLSTEDGQTKIFRQEYRKMVDWQETGLRFGIVNLESVDEHATRLKIWFSDGHGEPAIFWIDNNSQTTIDRGGTSYIFSAKQRYATGLQVVRDPGVWLVYIGCALLLIGLYITFFLSHKRIWLILQQNRKSHISFSLHGDTSKNMIGFERQFNDLAAKLKTKTHE